MRGHDHVVEAVALGTLHYSSLVGLAGNANGAEDAKPSAGPVPIEKVSLTFSEITINRPTQSISLVVLAIEQFAFGIHYRFYSILENFSIYLGSMSGGVYWP